MDGNEGKATVLRAKDVRSLRWSGDSLVDWAQGGVRYLLDGTVVRPDIYYPFRFDGALVSPSGELVLLYERLGTKAILIRAANGEVVRELSRSFYCAQTYEYPITFLRLPDGSDGIAHCPHQYSRIDIEQAVSGRCFTDGVERAHEDVFHSRLAVSPGGGYLLSAGWFWAPYDFVAVIPIVAALADARALDAEPLRLEGNPNVDSAVWLGPEQLAIATRYDSKSTAVGDRLWTWHAGTREVVSDLRLPGSMGTMHRLGERGLLGLFAHPRLYDLATGEVRQQWPHLGTGKQQGSTLVGEPVPPPVAVHPTEPWFAVAGPDSITVVQLAN